MQELIQSDGDRDQIVALYGQEQKAISGLHAGAHLIIELRIKMTEILTRRQSQCKRGEWTTWLATLPFSQATAYNWMKVYKEPNFQHVGNLTDSLLLIADSEHSDKRDNNSETLAEEAKRTGLSPRTVARTRRVKAKAEPEVVQALADGRISIATAESIVGNNDRPTQLANLSQAPQAKEKPQPPPPAQPPPQEEPKAKTAPSVKPKDLVPVHLLRGIITADQYAKGFSVYSDVNGRPCSLSPGVSDLEHRERAAHMIGGSTTEKDRKAYHKWERYDTRRVRLKVLKVLEQMSPLEVPKAHKAEGFVYQYDLNKSQDLRELAMMLSADLLRRADALEQQETYGHLFINPDACKAIASTGGA